MTNYQYQVGGSLKFNSPSYVDRQADRELYEALRKGEFCYILNSRQMGKSSLRVRIKHRLKQEGYSCVSVDLTSIGSQNITPQQWYKGLIYELWRGLNYSGKINLKFWWKEQEGLSPVKILQRFIEDVLLTEISSEKIFIFIDEIDSILSLNFSSDDFFAFIRFCYNKRAENLEYNRLTFAIFGVATPSDLIQDRDRTPFNIGKAIQLQGFQLEEVKPLAKGLAGKVGNPQAVLKEILFWTGGQPFLTQKFCQLVWEYGSDRQWDNLQVGDLKKVIQPKYTPSFPNLNSEDSNKSIAQIIRQAKIAYIVESQIINNWEFQDEPEHLRTIRDRLLKNEQRTGRLLGIYQKILQQGHILTDNSVEQIDLLLSGLVVKKQGELKVYNRIYEAVFNREWVEKELSKRRPYSENLRAWIISECTDESRLLRGKALEDAQAWAVDKSLSDWDYHFLAASQELDKKEVQTALEAAEIANRILSAAQQKAKRTIRLGLIGLSTISVVAIFLLGLAANLSMQAAKQKQQATLSEIQALITSSKALLANKEEFDALLESLRAAKKLQFAMKKDPEVQNKLESSLQEVMYWIKERNRLQGHRDSVMNVTFSPDGQLIVSSDREGTVKIWSRQGKELQTLQGHEDAVWSLNFSSDSKTLVTGSEDKTIKIWQRDESGKFQLQQTLRGHKSWVVSAIFCPKNRVIVSASWDGKIKIWNLKGKEIHSFQSDRGGIFDLDVSPDEQMFASAAADGTIELWSKEGKKLKTIEGHTDWVFSVKFSSYGQTLASSSRDGTIKLWSKDGKERVSFRAHNAAVFRINFSPDGQTLASASWDTTVKLWSLEGKELETLKRHQDSVWGVSFSPDGQTIASASEDRTIKLWQLNNNTLKIIQADNAAVRDVTFSPDGNILATAGLDFNVKLWSMSGKLLQTLEGFNSAVRDVAFSPDSRSMAIASWGQTIALWQQNPEGKFQPNKILKGHTGAVWSVKFSPDSQIVASASEDKTIKLWDAEGTEIGTSIGHEGAVFSIDFSPDGKTIVSGSEDKTIKLWHLDGTLIRTFKGHKDWAIEVSFSPDGKTIASAGRDGTIKIWTLEGKEYLTLKSPQDSIGSASFSPDGKTIASGSYKGTINLWNPKGKQIQILQGHNGAVRSVSFSPDGKILASSDSLGKVIIWNLDIDRSLEALTQKACNWVRDYLQNNLSREKSVTNARSQDDRQLCHRPLAKAYVPQRAATGRHMW